MSNKLYEILCFIYKILFSRLENFLFRINKIKKNDVFTYKFVNNVKYRVSKYENYEKIQQNKYLNKIIFPREEIKNLILDIFQKENLAEKITNLTGFNYKVDFFTAYETSTISKIDIDKGWYANHYHKDKPYSLNMIKIIFSFENIKEFNGPMEVKLFDKLNNKEKKFKVILDKNEIFLFNPVNLLHRATSPVKGKRFQIMMQLNPSHSWKVNQNIYNKQKFREPKFPFFNYFFDKNCELNQIKLK